MQIDTHIIDTTETENNVKNDVKNRDLSLIQGRRCKKSCGTVPKSWSLSVERWFTTLRFLSICLHFIKIVQTSKVVPKVKWLISWLEFHAAIHQAILSYKW